MKRLIGMFTTAYGSTHEPSNMCQEPFLHHQFQNKKLVNLKVQLSDHGQPKAVLTFLQEGKLLDVIVTNPDTHKNTNTIETSTEHNVDSQAPTQFLCPNHVHE
jgi:hypothetical protein